MKKKSDIKFLSFEGGGGKGNAYLGALYSLQESGIIQFRNSKLLGNVKGISGASAGAITAFFIGSGFNAFELYHLLTKDFNRFFDYPIVGENAIAGKGFSFIDLKQGEKNIKDAPTWLKILLNGLRKTGVIDSQLDAHLLKENPFLHKKLKDKLKEYILCLIADWGLFSGRTIQEEFFEFWLQYKIFCAKNNLEYSPAGTNKDAHNYALEKLETNSLNVNPCTFKEHYEIFGIELAFTSVNFKTENVQVFSYKTTPNFPISTAVRMSMSLPLIFKPVIINRDAISKFSLPNDFEGFWVDGGLFDNAPARVFNDVSRTVLFRLGNRQANNSLKNLLEFLKTYFKIGIMGTGSGQVNFTTVPELNVVELDVSGLSLLKFNLDTNHLTELSNRNKKIVDDYFQTWSP